MFSSSLLSGNTKSCGCSKHQHAHTFKDLTGKRFGDLVVDSYVGISSHLDSIWKCKCDCGSEVNVTAHRLNNGDVTHCGCKTLFEKHGMSDQQIYYIWKSMRSRCNRTTDHDYKDYGGRGIKVCEEWNNSFMAFYNDMSDVYKEGLELDRIDNDLGYFKENCHWVTRKENVLNRRNTVYIHGTIWGDIPLKTYSEKCNVKYNTLAHAKKRMTDEEILAKYGKGEEV